MVQYSVGAGFPVYYSAHTVILDGRNGHPLSTPELKSSLVGVQSSPLTISTTVSGPGGQGEHGHDMFLYWLADCHANVTDRQEMKYEYAKGTNVHEQSRSDQCRVRFNTDGYSRLYLLNPASPTSPTSQLHLLYDSESHREREHAEAVNTTREGLEFVRRNPAYENIYRQYASRAQTASDDGRSGSEQHGGGGSGSERDRWSGSEQQGHRSASERRPRRHVGAHDSEGIQRLISTGTLAPSLVPQPQTTGAGSSSSMDVIFAVYWFYPAYTRALLDDDIKCVRDRVNSREQQDRFGAGSSSMYSSMDHDDYVHAVTVECLQQSGRHYLSADSSSRSHTIYETQSQYNPFNVHMGQMTVYRSRITCSCNPTGEATTDLTSRCAHISPYPQQGWPAYLGQRGDAQYNGH